MVRIAAFLVALLTAHPGIARESPPVTTTRSTATLVSDTDTAQQGKPLHLGLRLRLKPGWHTYWQNPGDAGIAPELNLTLSDGATQSALAWPVPARQAEGPLMTYAYTGDVLLPVTVTPARDGLTAEATATWLVCEKVCVPEEGRFTLDLPAGDPKPSPEAPAFANAAARLPANAPFAARIAPDATLTLAGPGLSPATVREAWFFPLKPGIIDHAAPQPHQINDGTLTLTLKPGTDFTPAAALDGILVLKDSRNQEISFQIAAAPGGATATPSSATPLWWALLMALAGGLVLNLMPCVFPILAMKAVGLARLSNQARSTVQAHAASYTAGILAAFAALAAIVIASRTAGSLVGWGFQFQSPVFVAATAWLLFGVGLNLSGLFQLEIPGTGAGQYLARREGHIGSFFTGLLAVLVATPCTAPFMGVALAVALRSPAIVTLTIFLAMGLGLATPYLLLTLLPGLAKHLPRPGVWMETLKGFLAFPMYAAVAWLVWVVSVQAGPTGVLATATGLVLLAFAAWTLGLAQSSRRRALFIVPIAALAALIALLPQLETTPGPSRIAAEGAEPFTPQRLATLRAEGRPVFVNLTAAWCVSCLVNERVALSSAKVHQAFANHRIAYLLGDWTRNDPMITAYLREHQRDGVPLYLLYPKGAAAPTILPQILTETEMLSQIDRLGA